MRAASRLCAAEGTSHLRPGAHLRLAATRRFSRARPMRMLVMRLSSGWTITRLYRVQ